MNSFKYLMYFLWPNYVVDSRTIAVVGGHSRLRSCHRAVDVRDVVGTFSLPNALCHCPCRFLYNHMCLSTNNTVTSSVLSFFLSVMAGGCGNEYRSKSVHNQQVSLLSTNPTNILYLCVSVSNNSDFDEKCFSKTLHLFFYNFQISFLLSKSSKYSQDSLSNTSI